MLPIQTNLNVTHTLDLIQASCLFYLADCATTGAVPPPDPAPPHLLSKAKSLRAPFFHSPSDVFDGPEMGRSFGGYVLVYLPARLIEVRCRRQLKVSRRFLVCITTDCWLRSGSLQGQQQCLCFQVMVLSLSSNQRLWCGWGKWGTVDGIVSPSIRHCKNH
jgi:hypothetical protein